MYDFRTLSPLDFEALVRDLLQQEMGVRLEAFGSGRDGGVDLRYAQGTEQIIVQAKHYVDSDGAELVRAMKRENPKIAALAPARYILATSRPMTPGLKQKLIDATDAIQVAPSDVLGREDLNNLLGRHPEIERMHFKLWLTSAEVLQRILHAGVYNRTETELEAISRFIPKFVHNESIQAAEAILGRAGTLIISGQPGVGKTTLARMLVWLHAADGWKVSVVDDMKEAFEVSAAEEKRVIFFDDFLGQVRLSTDILRGTDQRFRPFFERVRHNKSLRFILTSRDYILRQAQAQSQRLAAAEVHASEMILNVGVYTRPVRARMLFNHLYFSDMSEQEREGLLDDDYFLKVIDHRNFNPRLVSILTSAEYVSLAARPIRETIDIVLNNPEELWERPYRSHVTPEGRALMLALLFAKTPVTLSSLERTFRRMAGALGLGQPDAMMSQLFRSALKELEGSVVAIQDRNASFANPGVKDFLTKAVRTDDLLPHMLKAFEEYRELSQAWDIFATWSDNLVRSRYPRGWAAPLKRVLDECDGTDLDRFDLAMSIYQTTKDPLAAPLLDQAIEQLAAGELEVEEAPRASSMLEDKVMWDVPTDVAERAHEALTLVVAKCFAESASEMQLQDLESVASALSQHGAEDQVSYEALGEGIERFLRNISESLDEIWSISELDEFEREVRRVANAYFRFDYRHERPFDARRDYLRERDEPHGEYRSGGSRLEPTMSDDEIKSMFSVLRRN